MNEISDELFFQENAFKPSLWNESWEYIRNEGIILHESPKTVPYKNFPPILSRFAWHLTLAVIAPKREWNSVLIPFSPLYHDQQYFRGFRISDICTALIEAFSSSKIFVASARPSCCFFAEIEKFKYEVIFRIAGTNEDKPFFLFDESLSWCFGFDYDFEYSFFSSPYLKQDDERLKGTFAEWDTFFVDNFVRTAPKNTSHLKLFENILRPSIPRTLSV